MQFLFDIINKPFGWILKNLAGLLGGNFAASVFCFTLLINLLLIPLSIKSQKSSVQQTRIKPKLDELKKRYGDDKQKYSEAMQNLYTEEGVSMSGGCLPLILRMVFMMSIYWLIMSPLTYMTGVDANRLSNVTTTVSSAMQELKKEDEQLYNKYKAEINWQEGSGANNSNQLGIVNLIRNDEVLEEILSDKQYKKIKDDLNYIKEKDAEVGISYTLFTDKINLTDSPKFSFKFFEEAELIWLLPICAFAAQMLTSVLSSLMQKKINPDAPSMMGMMLMMPLFSLWIGFTLPGGVTFYWICSSLIGGFIQLAVQQFYGPHKMLSRERLKELNRQCDLEETQLKKFKEALESDN